MCLVREDYGKQPGVVLHGDDRDLRWELRVNEGTKLYLEPLPEDVPDVEASTWTPKAFAEIERSKNLIELKVKLPNKEIHKLKINRTITLGEFKQQIIPLVQLTVDEFKVLKGSKVRSTCGAVDTCHSHRSSSIARNCATSARHCASATWWTA